MEPNLNGIVAATLAFSWVVHVWNLYLTRRQIRLISDSRDVPKEVKSVYDQKTFEKAQPYQLDKNRFSCWHELYSQLLLTAVLVMNVLPYSWQWTGRVALYFGLDEDYEISVSVLWLFFMSIFNTIADLPWTVYCVFVIEERHGFNKQTPGFFAKDQLKKFVVGQCIVLPIMATLIYIISWGGDYFFVYAWIFCCVISLVLVTIYADFIAPLFDKFTPLPEGDLRTAIEELAQKLSFPLKKLYVVENSKRSTHSNAYFYGFFNNKRIVLFDTLLEKGVIPKDDAKSETKQEEKISETDNGVEVKSGETKEQIEAKSVDGEAEADDKSVQGDEQRSEVNCERQDSSDTAHQRVGCNTEEILAVLSHELGHWKYSHVLKQIIIAQANLFICLAAFGILMNQRLLFEAFGFTAEVQPIIIRLIVIFQFVFQPYNEVLDFLMTQLTRRFEFQADRFAHQLSQAEPLMSALMKLNKDNLGFPIADPWYAAFHHSHPSLVERLQALTGKVKEN